MVEDLHESNADEAEGSPYEKHFRLQVGVLGIDHVGRAVGDCPVQEPVTGRAVVMLVLLVCENRLWDGVRHGETLRASLQWEEFTSDNPRHGSP